MPGLVLHLNGWPGAGKLSVGRLLAARLPARLIDNHLLLDPARALHPHGSPVFYALFRAVREVVLAEAEALPPETSFVFTDALSDLPEDVARFERIRAFARARGAPFRALRLEVSLAENLRRVAEPMRAERGKLTDPALLEEARGRHRLLEPPGLPLEVLDVSALSPAEACEAVLRRIG